ncbi:SusD/RagB family nutrient-binding outer membrane lipoprotein [Pedobacter sp. PAMC26386]|nr:SusD/RagB family nutrient-binding outer membrane lipoprotein [Pedobacter sp. PAMC26386]
MKKLIINISFFLVALTALVSCKKDVADKYSNPEKSKDASLSGLFTAMLNNDRIAAKYWNVRTFLCQMPGVYAQTSYFPNTNSVYQQSDGYSQNYWDDFYATGGNGSGSMAQYRSMEAKYKTLSDADKVSQGTIMQAAKVVLIEQAAKMVDLWGDIPYSETGSLETNSIIKNPKFDEQKALYTSFISDLAIAATYFKTNATNKDFAKADILLSGDVNKWARYANSLRLRLLMRISKVDEGTARTAVMEMLNNTAAYPLADGGNNPVYNPGTSDILLQPLTNSTSDLSAAFREGSWFATDYLLNTVMLTADDPRIPVIYDKYGRIVRVDGKDVFIPNKTYKAMPVTMSNGDQDTYNQDYAVLDSATFLYNQKLPGIIITAAEVNFLKAEAYERWGSSSSAQAAYENGLRQSVTFYYFLNNLNKGGGYVNLPAPSGAVVDKWVTASSASYAGSSTDKLKSIYTQKWAHLGVLQSNEAWAEYRRTGYPVLTFPSDGKLSGFDTPPTRLIYPAKEITLNTANYKAVQAKDTRKTKIFWQQ